MKNVDVQPRFAVSASRILGAVAMLAGLFPVGASAFGWVDDWGPDQYNAYSAIVGGVVTAIALVLGIQVEHHVTPVRSPRNDDLTPLVPLVPISEE